MVNSNNFWPASASDGHAWIRISILKLF